GVFLTELQYANIVPLKKKIDMTLVRGRELASPFLSPFNSLTLVFDSFQVVVPSITYTLTWIMLTEEGQRIDPYNAFDEAKNISDRVKKVTRPPNHKKWLDYWCDDTKGGAFADEF
ncbi:MAG: hypothetical protein OK436_06595, partial [Thaumarchaeota archaeon]|nr:hypothetical protein [Nitrososphaerota archaeon]